MDNLLNVNAVGTPKHYKILRDMVDNKYYYQYSGEPIQGPYRTRFLACKWSQSDAIEKNGKNSMIDTFINKKALFKTK